jgi:hypothetical protein
MFSALDQPAHWRIGCDIGNPATGSRRRQAAAKIVRVTRALKMVSAFNTARACAARELPIEAITNDGIAVLDS